MYLYRAVDSDGQTLEFLLSPIRDAEAAKLFFCKVLHVTADCVPQGHPVEEPMIQSPTLTDSPTTPTPRVINADNNAAYPKAIADLKAAGMLAGAVVLQQVKYLNNLIEQDHRFIKRQTKPGMGFFSFETAWRTFQGYEIMNILRKGQGIERGAVAGLVALVANLFGMAT
ncbi:hypothetical protein KSB_88520 [Ktedonobacter robiniae]|uniref:DDE domain-containing protein n=1 Tax=Ktedonobacter robiniae TaxID=2778365 RepID=A0ABQ3V6J5_9CHLR|nr:hypothetical protein KSB_88520 [Ktedonobacter robiniae]